MDFTIFTLWPKSANKHILHTVFISLISTSLSAKSDKHTIKTEEIDLTVSGRVGAQLEVKRLKEGESEYDLKLKIETEKKQGIKAVATIRNDSDNIMFVEDVYIESDIGDSYDLIVGRHKKILGLEYENSKQKRLSHRRSYIYRKLETFGYVGRESTIRFEKKRQGNTCKYRLSLGYDESTDANFTPTLDCKFASLKLINSTLLQSDKFDEKRQFVWANALSFAFDWSSSQAELELFYGIDPLQSEFEKTYGDTEFVNFFSTKVAYLTTLFQSHWQTLTGVSYHMHDTEFPGYKTFEYRFGLRYNKDIFHSGFELDVVETNSKTSSAQKTYDDTRLQVYATYYF